MLEYSSGDNFTMITKKQSLCGRGGEGAGGRKGVEGVMRELGGG